MLINKQLLITNKDKNKKIKKHIKIKISDMVIQAFNFNVFNDFNCQSQIFYLIKIDIYKIN